MQVINRQTGEIKTAIYVTTASGNKRYTVDGIVYSDRKFDSMFERESENAKGHLIVRRIIDEDGTTIQNDDWHLVSPFGDSRRILCTGEVFEYGEGTARGEIRRVKKGVTCLTCCQMIQFFKSIKL